MPGLHLLRQEQHCEKQRMFTAKALQGHELVINAHSCDVIEKPLAAAPGLTGGDCRSHNSSLLPTSHEPSRLQTKEEDE